MKKKSKASNTSKSKNKVVKRKVNVEKLFCFISFVFIMVCILWYGGRFIYFYLDSKKTNENNQTLLAEEIINKNINNENFRLLDDIYYFYKQATNNYVNYSNLTWRIVKIGKDKEIVLIADNYLTTLAYGQEVEYQESYIHQYLNKTTDENTDSLEEKLNNYKNYLIKSKICIDSVNNVKNVTCNTKFQDYYLGLLSVEDYINTGAKESFIANGEYTYLANQNKEKEIWYVNEEGKLDTTDGTDIMGIKPVITLKSSTNLISGTGSKEDPYKIEEETSFFGGYVKLGEDIWRVYDSDGENIKLVLTETLKVQDTALKYAYSKNNSYYNDTNYASLAYYLNHTYLDSLSYKNLVINSNYNNGYYGSSNNYQEITNQVIDTFVAIPSVIDINLSNADGYSTLTGSMAESTSIYVKNHTGLVSEKGVKTENNILPCITINKNSLVAGNGSFNDPYRTE